MRDRYIQDTRIHCCIYFISPTGHSLRPIDIIVIKKLSEVVNVVPVIAKSDTLTIEERDAFKLKVCYAQMFQCNVLTPRGCWRRFGKSWCTTASACTPMTLTRTMMRRPS